MTTTGRNSGIIRPPARPAIGAARFFLIASHCLYRVYSA